MPRTITTPNEAELGLSTLANPAGLAVSALPNGSLYSLEFRGERGRIQINQVLGQPLYGGIARILIRIEGEDGAREIVGPGAAARFAAGSDRFVWEGEAAGIAYRATLTLDPKGLIWRWHVSLRSDGSGRRAADLVFVQDLGLGDRGFVMGSEAYVSQYIDHHIAEHPEHGPVIMSRQAQAQNGRFPWTAIGLVGGAVAFATDAMQILGPDYRVTGKVETRFGQRIAEARLQHEVACAILQSRPVELAPGAEASVAAFGLFIENHPAASGEEDLQRLGSVAAALAPAAQALTPAAMAPSLLQTAPLLRALDADDAFLARFGPLRAFEERWDGALLSFFVPEGALNRHVVLAAKERLVARRHGAMIRSGRGMMLDDQTLCATLWMHGVFAAQLTIGNTSFHKLFSVSRDPYNITRASGLRILVDCGDGWRLLGVPTAFDMGLGDARWLYRLAERVILVEAACDGDAPALQWRVSVEGAPCRFLVLGHVVAGERELEWRGTITTDEAAKRVSVSPLAGSLWGDTYPDAVYHLVTSTPADIDAIGGDELLQADGRPRGFPYIALRTGPTQKLVFAVVGSMTDRAAAAALADRYAGGVAAEAMLAPAEAFWRDLTRSTRFVPDTGTAPGETADVEAQSLFLPWLAHDAMIHFTVPHGLEQYTGAAWGTRDVCQGPVEYLLAMEHDAPVRETLAVLFGEQHAEKGDWPQWFMLEPYSQIRAGSSHGDVIVWPLKALCDYVEATGDDGVLDLVCGWRDDGGRRSARPASSVADHVRVLVDTCRQRFIPDTHLIRYGEGDWNDSLQPVDHVWPDWMVSSWTVALLYEQLRRYAVILRRRGAAMEADDLDGLAAAMQSDVRSKLMRHGVLAGYGLFDSKGGGATLLLHPDDETTGIQHSLIPMTQAIIGGLFDEVETKRHLELIERHLLFPDGARLMDRPLPYHGGVETMFRRAESAAFFGREIGLMYVHAHLRYAEALSVAGQPDGLWEALALVNPISLARHLPNASVRQRNTYFSSSDAAFRDRYQASAEWDRVKAGTIAVDGGWRIYSSGPGLFTNMLIRHAFGERRDLGARVKVGRPPKALERARLVRDDFRPPLV